LDSIAALLSPQGVRLLLQMQLLAAGRVQRQSRLRQQQRTVSKEKKDKMEKQSRQQQQQSQEEFDPQELNSHEQATLLIRTSAVLGLVIKTAVRGGSSSLPVEVLQQASLQLLQALAAPMQQRLLSKAGDPFVSEREALLRSHSTLYGAVLHTQYSLRAAACGLGGPSSECFLYAT
jgi:TolA-binding protein